MQWCEMGSSPKVRWTRSLGGASDIRRVGRASRCEFCRYDVDDVVFLGRRTFVVKAGLLVGASTWALLLSELTMEDKPSDTTSVWQLGDGLCVVELSNGAPFPRHASSWAHQRNGSLVVLT